MTQRNPIAPGQGAESRIAELHRLCDEDFVKGQQQRAIPNLAPSYAAASLAARGPVVEPTDLDVAISVAQQLLDSDSVVSLRESVRLLLRALGAEPVDEQEAVRRSVDSAFPTIAAFLAEEQPTAEAHDPIGPGCGAPATARIEGYSPRSSLDIAVYACDQHKTQARTEWLGGLNPHTMPVVVDARCGHRFDYTTLGGGQ